MGFWMFMFVCNLLIPIIMFGFGKYFEKHAPKEINGIFGYRTPMSMKNKDTWQFAHNYCGTLWKRIGLLLLVITSIVSLSTITLNEDGIGIVGGILCGIQLICLVGSIFLVEKALKKTFDKDGNLITTAK